MKKVISLVLVMVLLCGCTKKYSCEKSTTTDDFEYKIKMDLAFSSGKIKTVNTEVTYDLTDAGYKKIDTLNESLESKSKNYNMSKYVTFNFKVEDKKISVFEDIDLSKSSQDEIDKVLKYDDVSTIYFNSKYKLDDVISELKNNDFSCSLK